MMRLLHCLPLFVALAGDRLRRHHAPASSRAPVFGESAVLRIEIGKTTRGPSFHAELSHGPRGDGSASFAASRADCDGATLCGSASVAALAMDRGRGLALLACAHALIRGRLPPAALPIMPSHPFFPAHRAPVPASLICVRIGICPPFGLSGRSARARRLSISARESVEPARSLPPRAASARHPCGAHGGPMPAASPASCAVLRGGERYRRRSCL